MCFKKLNAFLFWKNEYILQILPNSKKLENTPCTLICLLTLNRIFTSDWPLMSWHKCTIRALLRGPLEKTKKKWTLHLNENSSPLKCPCEPNCTIILIWNPTQSGFNFAILSQFSNGFGPYSSSLIFTFIPRYSELEEFLGGLKDIISEFQDQISVFCVLRYPISKFRQYLTLLPLFSVNWKEYFKKCPLDKNEN